MTTRKKLLVLVDGSPRSMNTVEYLSLVKPFFSYQVTLYHVFTGLPEAFFDLEKDPVDAEAVHQLLEWEARKKKEMSAFMGQAKDCLVKAGFAPDAVEIKIHMRKKGIARDILTEAEEGYGAVVLRRRGMGALEGVTIGSVASKLISKLSFLPVIIAGQRPPGQKILIGIDGSGHSIRAAEFAGMMFAGYGYSIELVHVIRGITSALSKGPEFMMPADYLKELHAEMGKTFSSIRQKLILAGFEENKISEKIITGVISRAGAIVQEADSEECGTIIVGRKGLSSVQEFFMGRVSNKVIHAGRKHTVWVV